MHRFDQAISYEWLETNGLGGYASSTVIGAHSRRYHGLLVAATQPPVKRVVMLSKLDETLHVQGQSYELGTNKYQGTVYPNGYIFQQEFKQGLFPEFIYQLPGAKLKKSITAIHGENTVVISYELLESEEEVRLDLRPMLSPRNYHNLAQANSELNQEYKFERGIFTCKPYADQPDLYLGVPGAAFRSQPDWYYRLEYLQELERGMAGHEDLFSPGFFELRVSPGQKVCIIASLHHPQGRRGEDLVRAEANRRRTVIKQSGYEDPFMQQLCLAADQFVAQRGNGLKTIVAGYPWFTDWGRDTMISLPGLCLATGRFEDAKKILLAFAQNVSQGMIPNRFPDNGESPLYNTIDGTLWLFVAVYKYLQVTQDKAFVLANLLPILGDILGWHERGTRHNIKADEDGLLAGGEEGYALTWMDAKAHDWVVTPRRGKAVEIQALWYNAWMIYAFLLKAAKQPEAAHQVEQKAESIRQSFVTQFWNPQALALFDVVNGDQKDPSIRPNQIFAISLPFPLLDLDQSYQVLDTVERELLTPVGLRSLSPQDPSYQAFYQGDQYARDGAYHQGTVWSWLLGPYLDALIRVRGGWGRDMARMVIAKMQEHLGQAGVGNVSEIFDGASPFTPRGCTAQAWGVAELLRVAHEQKLYPQRVIQAAPTATQDESNSTLNVHPELTPQSNA
ncbi:MAG: amylo-alpha-1,6-glucosidase [Bacteroidota bacterium]